MILKRQGTTRPNVAAEPKANVNLSHFASLLARSRPTLFNSSCRITLAQNIRLSLCALADGQH